VSRPRRWTALALALAAGAALAIRLDRPGFFDYEGRYAEVAREMLLRRDFVTPELDFTLFLNKPPLLYWLGAAAFALVGTNEWARLVSVCAGIVTLLATCRLGARLYGETTGLAAAAFLATMAGFGLEARKLRPDSVLAATVAVAVLCWVSAERAATSRRRSAWLVALYAALGVGVMAKGPVVVALAGVPIGADLLSRAGWRGLGRLALGRGLTVLAAIIVPWHLLVAERHPGFAWDYIVNQHLLFFLDRKLPRDSEGISLAAFWGAFAGRAFPWILLVAFARGGSPIPWAWLAGVLALFSASPARLEHYTVPALPAVALLAARGWKRLGAGSTAAGAWRALALAGALLAAGAVAIVVWVPRWLGALPWTAAAPGLTALVVPAAAVLGLIGVLTAAAARARRPRVLAWSLGVGGVALMGILLRVETEIEPLLSWKPVAALLAARVPPATEIVFEAPEEYQLVGGLVFYTRRPITLLEPPGFVPPAYLEGQAGDMFLSRAAFAERWRAGEPLVFVSDLQRHRESPDGLVPAPYVVLGRFGYRWVLATRAAAG
jgi:4-amino-4-deoxy-L-arabinose transferase-like glycosyltransferase